MSRCYSEILRMLTELKAAGIVTLAALVAFSRD